MSRSSMACSLALHGAVLGWVATGRPGAPPELKPSSLYQQEIAPHRDRLVWFSVRGDLPEISPLERHGISQPPRAEARARQEIVTQHGPNARQLIWQPAPALPPKIEVRAPNLLAFGALPTPPSRPARLFAPRVAHREAPPQSVPLPPDLKAALERLRPLPPETAVPRPQPRQFVPPPTRAASPRAAVAAPPQLAAAATGGNPLPSSGSVPRPQPRQFVPPPAPAATPRAAVAAPPQLAAAAGGAKALLPFGPVPRPQPRQFVPPPARAASPRAAVAAPPQLAAAATGGNPLLPSGSVPHPQPRDFTPPPRRIAQGPSALPAAPGLSAGSLSAAARPPVSPSLAAPQRRRLEPPPANGAPAAGLAGESLAAAPALASASIAGPSLAVVGLNPAERLDAPLPEGSREGRFAAGPAPRARGGEGEPVSSARIFVPGLMARGGAAPAAHPVLLARAAPTSPEALAAAACAALANPAAALPAPPDPSFAGRLFYSLTAQMPNITSYSGSWLLWFAERGALPGSAPGMLPPVPVRKVDPKYYPATMAEGIQGTVRLAAIIGRDGRVSAIAVLRSLDERLDHSAAEALRQWEFQPAMRNGAPIDVDAIVEIPFRLAPKPGKR